MDSKKRWKSLAFKVQHLRLELEYREEYLRQLETSFNQQLTKLDIEDVEQETSQPLIGVVTVPPPEPSGETQSANPAVGPDDLKKLWRTIAAKCHPDKTRNDAHKTELYKEAESAWRTGSVDRLYHIALALGIEPLDQSNESLSIMIGISNSLEIQIQQIEKSVLWIWGNASPEDKNKIIDLYLKNRGKKRKNK